jgi:hypothetical protein
MPVRVDRRHAALTGTAIVHLGPRHGQPFGTPRGDAYAGAHGSDAQIGKTT